MKCKKAQKYLTAFVDGELRGRWRRVALKRHLDNCVPCQRMLAIQRQIKHLLQTRVRRVKTPDNLKNNIRRLLHDQFLKGGETHETHKDPSGRSKTQIS
ncbi:hypothetical protein GWO43_07100 [candidate division KSB1 bacterium]|nr:hypothetical protein [candidate division KSB1 bacterium]NIR72775.1 hypothetical protein [candidate division KSB1 bacterium]NIS23731.1 hypothetical protein [candidate division KSB1 bacterium]NIT70651.1 hypothetical protein [candidate division KSB1 bacterium]NIU24379.1 hypothetical protein [candidate division KSB1 bacterium]